MKTLFALTAAFAVGASAQNPTEVLRSTYNGSAGLNDLAVAKGKYMGTATDIICQSAEPSDPYYMAELRNSKDWSIITSANLMKPSFMQPSKGTFTFSQADQFVSTIKGMGAKVRCHTLLWHQQNPDWLSSGSWTNATLLAALTDHITGVMTHFKDDCYAWDVVNEVLSDGDGYRDTFWYRTCGASYIAHAFNVANQVKTQLGLKTKLYYNDYNIEWAGSAKAAFAQNMVRNLLAQGVKIDGVGMQAHFEIGGTPSKSSLMSVMQVYTDMGLEVAITELDVRTPTPPSLAKQQQQVIDFSNVVGACADTPKCVGVTLWDFVDTYSWVPSVFPGVGWASPWYQPAGGNTPLVRKAAYDGMVTGWNSNTSPTTATPTTATPTTATPRTTPTATTARPTTTPTATTARPRTTPTATTARPRTTPTATTARPTTTPTPTTTATGATAVKWGQCGGINWTGPTRCISGSTCTKLNDWYFQCL